MLEIKYSLAIYLSNKFCGLAVILAVSKNCFVPLIIEKITKPMTEQLQL